MEDSKIAALRAHLATRIGAQRYELWFGPQTEFCLSDAGLIVRAASTFVRDWLRKNFAAEIRDCLETLFGHAMPLEFEVAAPAVAAASGACSEGAVTPVPAQVVQQAKPTRKPKVAVAGAATIALAAVKATQAGPPLMKPPVAPTRPQRELLLSGYVVGPSNEYAYRSAELTAHGRQQASPVLFCGTTGVGKTHLLRGIQREYRRCHPRAAAVYLTAEQFTTGFVEALRGSGLPSFRQKCRGADLLIIDDLQFFAGKQRTLEELLHSLDTLQAEGRQLVLAADRDLAALRALGPELASRLAGGLVCQMELPEFATRLGIARRLASEMSLAIDEEVLSMVAAQITAGARELRGALHRLQAMSQAFEKPISRELAEVALGELARQCTRSIRLSDVQQAVCDLFGVEAAQLRSDRKSRSVSEPRMLAMWLARKYTRAPWSEIGEFFGRRSHSTVISAHRRVEQLITAQAEVGLVDRTCNVEEAIRRLETALRTA